MLLFGPKAQFLVRQGLWYQPASLCSLAGRYDNPMPKSTFSTQSGTMNLATGSCIQYLMFKHTFDLSFSHWCSTFKCFSLFSCFNSINTYSFVHCTYVMVSNIFILLCRISALLYTVLYPNQEKRPHRFLIILFCT